MAYGFRRSVVEPLHRLTGVAERVAAGDLSARAAVQSRDEIGVLADSVNTMTHRLSQTIRHLESTFAEAQRAKASAEVASRAKSSFLANMSHELRTPLNAVLGYAQILQDEPGLSEFQANGLDKIRHGGEHLLALISDVLDLARIEAGKVELVLQPVNLSQLLRQVESLIRVDAQRKGLAFQCDFAPDLPIGVRLDGKRLEQVLLNLLGNAVKFTERGHIALRARRLPASDATQVQLQFEVADSGIGIDEAEMRALFRPFEQASDVQRQYGGTGLGLAISQQIVTLMGGCIRIDSEVGRGSVFRFELDVELARADAAEQSCADVDVQADAGRPAPSPRPSRPHAADALPPPMRVPPPEELELLHALARIGNMRSIGDQAEHLARLDPGYQPFAQRLRELAQRFQSRVILDWISELRQGSREDVNVPVRSSTTGL
jgi:signal transduction histidine kinase